MDDKGIMEQIRGFLHQGLSAPEIIQKGYASSTVYRVQRELRRKARALDSALSGKSVSPQSLAYWGKLEADNRLLQQRIESLESQLAEVVANPLQEVHYWLTDIQETLEGVITRQEQMWQNIAAVKAKVDKIDGELDDLAKVYKDSVPFEIWEPDWQRRT